MDTADEAIVELLKRDGRLAHREIARLSGLPRSAVATRMHRLLSSGEVAIRGVVHPAVSGRGSLAYVGLSVDGCAVPVASRIAERDDVSFVSLPTGHHDVVTELRAESALAIDTAVGELRAIPGVRAIDTVPYVEVIRDVVGPTGVLHHTVDATDLMLLRALQENGRASYVELAGLVALSPAGVRRRVVRLVEGQVIRIGALVRQSGRDHQVAMGLGIRLAGDHRDVTEALLGMPAVSFLARTLGRFDLLTTLRSFTPGQLTEALEAVRSLPGVHGVESWSHLRFVKESYASTHLATSLATHLPSNLPSNLGG
ncbi:MAG TPA: Lrp/AsnC family transcriptional regulator [Nocardioides sp.]|uniref:Lrp/AsnC family transcriptional regulator n=1 Tax=Nocardioides sp. TaxID=35761 RepID=UPI002ED9E2C8